MSAPATPTSLAITARGFRTSTVHGMLAVSWAGDPTATFRVQVRDITGTPVVLDEVITAVGELKAKLSNIVGDPSSYDHEVRVRAETIGGNSAYATLAFDNSFADYPATPTSLAVGTITGSSAKVTFAQGGVSDSYRQLELSLGGLLVPILIGVPDLDLSYTITGLRPGLTYSVRVRGVAETYSSSAYTSPVTFTTLGETAVIEGPQTITCRMGAAVAASYLYTGSGDPLSYGLSGGPPDVGAVGNPTWAGNPNIIQLLGTPSAPGIYDAEVTFVVVDGSTLNSFLYPVRFIVLGATFLDWLHTDPDARDFQISPRTKLVTSYSDPDFKYKLGESFTAYLVFRDQERVLNSYNPDSICLLIRPLDDFDAEPLVLFEAIAPEAINISGNYAYAMTVKVGTDTSAELRERFSQLNRSPATDINSATIACAGELMWTHGGAVRKSAAFAVFLEQDYSG